MIKVTLMGRDFEVAPYMIDALEEAAPFVDAVNSASGSLTTMAGGVQAASDLIGFLAVGLGRVDPEMTAAHLKTKLGFSDIGAMQQAFQDILSGSGFAPGEPKAAPQEAVAAA